MATQPNHSRDIETDILRALAEADEHGLIAEHIEVQLPDGHTTSSLALALVDLCLYGRSTGRPLVRSYSDGLVLDDVTYIFYALTDEGRRVAEARGLTGRAEG